MAQRFTMHTGNRTADSAPGTGLAGWLLGRLRNGARPQPRLALLERITLAPRQTLALVEAEGRRFLVATSPEGAPALFPLDEQRAEDRPVRGAVRVPARIPPGWVARVSW